MFPIQPKESSVLKIVLKSIEPEKSKSIGNLNENGSEGFISSKLMNLLNGNDWLGIQYKMQYDVNLTLKEQLYFIKRNIWSIIKI